VGEREGQEKREEKGREWNWRVEKEAAGRKTEEREELALRCGSG
jgi:hypothetical protein